MRRLPPHSKGTDSGNTPPASPSNPRVTLRLNQHQLKSARGANEEASGSGGSSSKKAKINLASSSGAFASEALGSDAHQSGKVKMENMEEILLKENTSAIETTSSQDESKDPLADTESVISPSSSHQDKQGGTDKDGASLKRVAEGNSSDEENKKKKSRKEEPGKTSSLGEGSPKATAQGGNDSESEDKNLDSPPAGGVGPKVPPLKIVLPSALAGTESDSSTGGSGRTSKSALPYVVASDIGGEVSGSAPPSPSTAHPVDANPSSIDADKPGAIKTEIKQEPLTEEQRVTQRILRSSHSRGSSSSSPAAPDVSPSAMPVNTPPSSAVPSPGVPDITTIKIEPQSSLSSNTTSTSHSTVDEKPNIAQVTTPNEESTAVTSEPQLSTMELHPRKRKFKHARVDSSWNTAASSGTSSSTSGATASSNSTNPSTTSVEVKGEVKEELVASGQVTSGDQTFTNCYQLYLNIRKQIDLRRKGLFPVKPITPAKFARYLMVTCDYVLADNNSSRHTVPKYEAPAHLPQVLKDLYTLQEQARYKLRMQHVVEKEKFALGVEQEILRVHCHAARELANQPLPYSVCTILKDEEVYNLLGPDTDDKDSIEHKRDKRTDRYRYNGRLFIKWLRDIDDKWDKIKKRMIIRQTNEAESLAAVQKMDWDWKVREACLDVPPPGEDSYVPMVAVVDDLQSTDELAT